MATLVFTKRFPIWRAPAVCSDGITTLANIGKEKELIIIYFEALCH